MKYKAILALVLWALTPIISTSCMQKPDFIDSTIKFVPNETDFTEKDIPAIKKELPEGAIDNIDDFGLFGIENYEQRWLYKVVSAIITNDVAELEKCIGVDAGTMASWEGMVISDYIIIPDGTEFLDMLTLELTVTQSNNERFCAGKYRMKIYEGPGNPFDIERLDAVTAHEHSAAEEWVYSWAKNHGGWMDIEKQSLADAEYAHCLTDLYLSCTYNEGKAASLEGFLKFCEERFGLCEGAETIVRESVESHGAHCQISCACEVETVAESNGEYTIKVNFFADQLYSVISRTYTVKLKAHDGYFELLTVTCDYNSGASTALWSM